MNNIGELPATVANELLRFEVARQLAKDETNASVMTLPMNESVVANTKPSSTASPVTANAITGNVLSGYNPLSDEEYEQLVQASIRVADLVHQIEVATIS